MYVRHQRKMLDSPLNINRQSLNQWSFAYSSKVGYEIISLACFWEAVECFQPTHSMWRQEFMAYRHACQHVKCALQAKSIWHFKSKSIWNTNWKHSILLTNGVEEGFPTIFLLRRSIRTIVSGVAWLRNRIWDMTNYMETWLGLYLEFCMGAGGTAAVHADNPVVLGWRIVFHYTLIIIMERICSIHGD